MEPTASPERKIGLEFAVMFLLLLALLSMLLHGVYRPEHTLFSNDGPLGRLMSKSHELPARFTGCWGDLNEIGSNGGTAPPGISFGLQFLLKPIWFSKLYALAALVILGLGAWCFFVQLRLAPMACILGGLAAALNSCFFSVACWGIAGHAITAGMNFLALAALADTSSRRRWFRVILAGLAVGMGVIEGADVGAIFSLYVAAFMLYQAWIDGGSRLQRIALGLSRVTLVAFCAALIAAPAIFSLVVTNIKGVVGTQQDVQTKATRWDWATQWSEPIKETPGFVIPGLFGYRMDAPDGGSYWGEVGRDPAVERFIENGKKGPPPNGLIRFSGGGFYAGVVVVMLALWAIAQSLRRGDSTVNTLPRKWIWFWLAVATISLLLSFGRFAPFYHMIYALPYFSTIRNPTKFINLVSFALIVMFTYGVDDLWRKYMQPSRPSIALSWTALKAWWLKADKYEKSWIRGCGLVLGIVLVAWMGYDFERQTLVAYLQTVSFDQSNAESTASFSIRQVGWFVLFFVLSTGLITCIFIGAFAGTRARWGCVLLGLFLVADLGRANLPWVVYWNYQEKYASNLILDRLRDKPYEHRVTMLPGQTPQEYSWLGRLYSLEWLQQQFPYYDIQSFDIVDMPRLPKDLAAYRDAVNSMPDPSGLQGLLRLWQLTNTRYVLGYPSALEPLNHAINQPSQWFRIVERFNIEPKLGISHPVALDNLTAVPDENGPYALLEYTGALPRAKLYSNWQINTNNQAVLEQLVSPVFDPNQCVLVAGELPAAWTASNTNANDGTVEFDSYAPKDIVLKSNARAPAVLLLNDHFDPNWKVFVDGKPEVLLCCNFIMRGVYLTPGTHKIEFQFLPPCWLLYVSLSAIGAGLLLLILVIPSNRGRSKTI